MGMISAFDVKNPGTYAYVGGCRNVVWLVGRIVHVDQKNRTIYLTRQTDDTQPVTEGENLERTIPIYYTGNTILPSWVKPGNDIRTICHVYSRLWQPVRKKAPQESQTAEGDHEPETSLSSNHLGDEQEIVLDDIPIDDIVEDSPEIKAEEDEVQEESRQEASFVRLVLKYIGRPEISDYSNIKQLANNISDANSMEDLIRRSMIFSRGSNYFEVAGFIETKAVRVGGSERHMRFILRQGQSDRLALTIDLIGKNCLLYKKNIIPSVPVLVKGSVIAGVNPIDHSPLAILRAENILGMTPDRDDFTFTSPPEWAKAIRARYLQLVEQERQRQLAIERRRKMLS